MKLRFSLCCFSMLELSACAWARYYDTGSHYHKAIHACGTVLILFVKRILALKIAQI